MYTVSCEYFATGEGHHFMVLFTRGYGPNKDPRINAMERFKKLFGDYFAQGAETKEGLNFDFVGAKFLVNEYLREKLLDWEKDAGGLEYHASLHLNFS